MYGVGRYGIRSELSGNSTVIFGVTVGFARISWKKYS
jgi:hypothetical protein